MPNEIYYPGIPETDKIKTSQYLLINNERTHKPDKIRLDKFISNLNIQTDEDTTNNLIEVTYAAAQALIASSSLIIGEHYKITDRADAGIILLAVSTNQFSLEGQGIFLNPDFQAAGALGADVQGVWYVGGEAGYVNGNIVFWNGNHYEVTDSGAFAGTDPSATPLAYTLLSKSVANGYIEEVDFILYDFDNDQVIEQHDKRGNIWNPSFISSFQRGNDAVKNNIIDKQADIDCINQRGNIAGNIISSTGASYVQFYNDFTGSLNNCTISSEVIFNNNATLNNCNLHSREDLVFDSVFYTGKTINDLGSTFDADLDMTNGVNYGLITERITIPANYNYVGEFRLINNTGQTITQINNLPTTHKCRFYVEDGNTQLFNHTSIGVAVTNNLVSDGAAINTIVGRTNGSDFIEYEKAGDFNRRYNAVILA